VELEQTTNLDGLLAALGIGLYETDVEGRVTAVDRVFEALVGYTLADLRGTFFGRLIVEQSTIPAEDCPLGMVGREFVSAAAATIRRKDGSFVAVRICSEPLVEASEVIGTHGAIMPLGRGWEPEDDERGVTLTPRQLEVLQLLASGCGTAEIARTLTISRETARNHVRAILHELDCHSRLEAVVVARRAGLVR
jgi:DNA-binding CsgD family transcriptional regulator